MDDINDQMTGAFWEELCQNDLTVEDAAEAYVYAKGYDFQTGWWTYGVEIKVYGNENGCLV